eukprot:3002555-Rhodomonas_salina.5
MPTHQNLPGDLLCNMLLNARTDFVMAGSDKTVYQAFHGTPPDNNFIKDTEWGCRAYLPVNKARCKDCKFD